LVAAVEIVAPEHLLLDLHSTESVLTQLTAMSRRVLVAACTRASQLRRPVACHTTGARKQLVCAA
jgi:hypothetical protein